MSKIQERIAEIDKASKKSRLINNILWVVVFGLVGSSGYLYLKASESEKIAITNEKAAQEANLALEESIKEVEAARNKYEQLEEKAQLDLATCLEAGNSNKWELAYKTNTLLAYSNFLEGCEGDEDCRKAEIEAAVNKILDADGYVQLIERNGNPLYTKADINLQDGFEYVKFKTDKSVRNGAIGIKDCGSSSPTQKGIVLQGKTVRILEKCEEKGTKSVWAHIQYTD